MTEEYVLGIIEAISREKEGLTPDGASREELLHRVSDDVLACLRQLYSKGTISYYRTLNSWAVKKK